VSGFDKEFAGKVHGKNVDATMPEAIQEIKALGFKSHGLVIRSPDGTVLWKQADHLVKVEDARVAIQELLKKK
jgi:hypothetical protein